ncbi:MAG: GNAT family N-acetyltransferase [Acidobacteriota bacterium]|nr:GNAT family N-acetyltransferase [Acidobacteriota bacterium]
MKGAEGLRVELTTLSALESEWRRLEPLARTKSVFVSWDYLSTWWRHFRRGREGRTYVVHDPQEGPLAIVPLYIEERSHRFGAASVLRNVGSGDVAEAELLDALVVEGRERDVARALAPALVADPRWDFASWSDLAPNGSLERIARFLAVEGRLEHRREERASSRYLPLPDSLGALFDRLEEERREAMVAVVQGVSASQRLTWRAAGDKIGVSCALRILSDLDQRRMKAQQGRSPFERADFSSFHRDLAERLRSSGRLRLSVLYGQSSPVAATYGFMHGSTYRAFCFAHEANRTDLRLEELSLAATLERLIEEGVKEIRFPAEGAACRPWTVRRRRTVSLQLVRHGLRARSAWARAGLSDTPRQVLKFLIGRERYEQLDAAWADVLESLRPDP